MIEETEENLSQKKNYTLFRLDAYSSALARQITYYSDSYEELKKIADNLEKLENASFNFSGRFLNEKWFGFKNFIMTAHINWQSAT